MHITEEKSERAFLVFLLQEDEASFKDKRDELYALAQTAGLMVAGEVSQRCRGAQRHLGRGKQEEVRIQVGADEVDVVVFNDTLSPSDTRRYEESLGTKVIDRSALILDIFAQRARTREGKLQVEMAQLSWLLPRLSGEGVGLSRLGGGIGTRGPGERKLETDRRHIRRRLHHVKEALTEVSKERKVQRAARTRLNIPSVSLVGYTNAGKSSLLNVLSQSEIYVADQLFATLDPTTRRVRLNTGLDCFISDTVGFIRELPPQLAIAFKATLEVLDETDLLLHVVDVSVPGFEERIQTVDRFLDELGLSTRPRLYVFNKCDLLDEQPLLPQPLAQEPHVWASAYQLDGTVALQEAMARLLADRFFSETVCLAHDDPESGALLAKAYALGEVNRLTPDERGTCFQLTGARHVLWPLFASRVVLNAADHDSQVGKDTE